MAKHADGSRSLWTAIWLRYRAMQMLTAYRASDRAQDRYLKAYQKRYGQVSTWDQAKPFDPMVSK